MIGTRTHRAAATGHLEQRLLFSRPFGTFYTGFGDPESPGSTSIDVDASSAAVDQLQLDRAGNLLVGGDGGIARFTAAGSVDDSFGREGLAALPQGYTFVAEAPEPHGRVYAVLDSSDGFVLARYSAAGRLDHTFGQSGIGPTIGDRGFSATAVTLETTGQIIVAGTESTGGGTGAKMRLFRFNYDGSLDTTFGSDGSVSVQLGTSTASTPIIHDQVTGIAAMPNGELLVGGGSFSYAVTASGDTFGPALFAAAKITPSGRLDTAYGANGIARDVFASAKALRLNYVAGPSDIQIRGFDARSDGSAVFASVEANQLVGNTNVSPQDFVAAFDAAGATVYDVGCTPKLTVALSDDYQVGGVVALAGGRADVLTFSAYNYTAAVTSVSSSGELGQTVTTYTETHQLVFGESATIGIAPNGKIVIAGGFEDYTLLELNQGDGFVPAFSGFPDATTSSIVSIFSDFDATVRANLTDVAYYNTRANCLMFTRQLGNNLWTTPVTIPSTIGVSQFFSLQIRYGRGPYIAFYDPLSKSLKAARSLDDGRTFKVETIDASGDAGEFASLTFNNYTNLPEVVYDNVAHQQLKFATEDDHDKWVISVIDSRVIVGDLSPSVRNTINEPEFAYLDAGTGQIKIVTRNQSDGWDISAATTVKRGVRGLSLAADGQSIAFYDVAHNALREVFGYDGSSDSGQTSTAASGHLTQIGLPQQDGYIYAYDPASDSVLKFSYGDPPEPQTVITHGGAYLQATSEYTGGTVLAYVDSRTGHLVVELARRGNWF